MNDFTPSVIKFHLTLFSCTVLGHVAISDQSNMYMFSEYSNISTYLSNFELLRYKRFEHIQFVLYFDSFMFEHVR